MIGMSREAIKRNAQGDIEYQTRLAKAGKDFSAWSIVESERMLKVAEIEFTPEEREQLKALALHPNPDWHQAKAIKEKYQVSWNELKTLAGTCVESTSEIKRIRKMSGLSRKDFAERYKIPIRTLEKWERQESNPAEYVVLLLERAVREDFKV